MWVCVCVSRLRSLPELSESFVKKKMDLSTETVMEFGCHNFWRQAEYSEPRQPRSGSTSTTHHVWKTQGFCMFFFGWFLVHVEKNRHTHTQSDSLRCLVWLKLLPWTMFLWVFERFFDSKEGKMQLSVGAVHVGNMNVLECNKIDAVRIWSRISWQDHPSKSSHLSLSLSIHVSSHDLFVYWRRWGLSFRCPLPL